MPEYVHHRGRIVSANFTRPSNTTAYTAGDVVTATTAAVMSFVEAVRGKYDYAKIIAASLIDSANVGTKPDLELWLFDATFTPEADNAAWAPTDAILQTGLGVIAFATGSFKVGKADAGADGNSLNQVQNIQLPIWSTVDGGVIYGLLVVRNAYVPVSAERFDVRLHVED